MNIPKELFDRLDALAAKLGIASQYLWGVLVRQGKLEAITDWIYGGVFILLAGFGFYVAWWFWKQDGEAGRFKEPWVMGTIISFIAGAIFLFGPGLGNILDGFKAWNNPEFWALQQIVHAL